MITLEQAALAFEKWESNYRANPTEFLTSEQALDIGVSEISANRAAYFIELLKGDK